MKNRRETVPAFQPEGGYYAYVSKGYDLISGTYELVEARNAVGRRIRHRMQAALLRAFRKGDRVLEVGCGPGIEAAFLASRGMEVLATDLSPEMVVRVRARAASQGLENLEARVLAARDVGALAKELGEGYFDGAYSHGGTLNMDPAIEDCATGLGRLVRPAGRFVCTMVNQTSLFEILLYPLALNPRKAFRRLGNVVPIPITRHEAFRNFVVPTRFYSPRDFVRTFEPAFVLRRLEGLQILLPPWNLSDLVDSLNPLFRPLEIVENWIADKWPFNEWGSLFLAELERCK